MEYRTNPVSRTTNRPDAGVSKLSQMIIYTRYCVQPIPVAARSKAWVCSRSLAVTAGSKPTGEMDVCLF
jgi:hypothetical protein